ncbi:phosphoribosylglycinamide formyltransferase [Microvirga sp. W0021]|uniref:Phosphoribosylglycinamide formyltransferase n=1 Tax=Hohaiivirga grylli TaxID=3133970 RepID=A0ABV0BIZ8_9HYPH
MNKTSEKKRIAVLISGRGSNMLSLLKLRNESDFNGLFSLVLSNKADAKGLETARNEGIETVFIDHKAFPDRESFDREMHATLLNHKIDFVVLAGFMRILSSWFVEQWEGRMINIHPSLLPLFRGVDTHRRALEEGVRLHGCTVHYVVPELDAGPIIAQAAVPVLPDDTEENLASRVLKQEHILYAQALKMICNHTVCLEGGKVLYQKNGALQQETAQLSAPFA